MENVLGFVTGPLLGFHGQRLHIGMPSARMLVRVVPVVSSYGRIQADVCLLVCILLYILVVGAAQRSTHTI